MAAEVVPKLGEVFRLASFHQGRPVAMEDKLMVTVTLGDIFTEDEVKHMAALVAQGASAQRIAEEVIEPVLERIDADTGQSNSALYLAYAVTYAIEELLKKRMESEVSNVSNFGTIKPKA